MPPQTVGRTLRLGCLVRKRTFVSEMKRRKVFKSVRQLFPEKPWLLIFFALLVHPAFGQSTSQDYPTPITSNEINGSIAARELGDPRLTAHYYLIETAVGDLFINVQTHSFTGDIDIFTLSGLQPLGKIVMYADLGDTETGRAIYLRKPEKLLLRIQGRTPGDEAATYRIKFAGSFVASREPEGSAPPELPRVAKQAERGDRVNSVGTLLETPAERRARIEAETNARKAEVVEKSGKTDENAAGERKVETAEPARVSEDEKTPAKVEVVTTDATNVPKETPLKEAPEKAAKSRNRSTPARRNANASRRTRPITAGEEPERPEKAAEQPSPPKVDPLASIKLVISLKDGDRLERPMNEVLRFTVDKGVLTVIAKDGKIVRYSLLDVSKVTIE